MGYVSQQNVSTNYSGQIPSSEADQQEENMNAG